MTIRLELAEGAATRHFWMLLFEPRAEVCSTSMGRHADLVMFTDAATLVDYDVRRTSPAAAMRAGRLQLSGPRELIRSLPSWIDPSPYAHTAGGCQSDPH